MRNSLLNESETYSLGMEMHIYCMASLMKYFIYLFISFIYDTSIFALARVVAAQFRKSE